MDDSAYLPMSLVIFNDTLDVVSASRDAFSLFGDRFHAGDYEGSLASLGKTVAEHDVLLSLIGGVTFKLKHVGSREGFHWKHDGRDYDVTVVVLPGDEGMRYGVDFKDVTADMQLGRERENARNYLEAILNSQPIGITVMDEGLQITTINDRQLGLFERMGHPMSLLQVVGVPAEEVFPEEDQAFWDHVREAVLQRGESVSGQEWVEESDDSLVVTSRVAPLRDGRGEVTGAVRIAVDVTVQRKLEVEARHAEGELARWNTMKQVAITLSHEINNMLTSIMTNVAVLRRVSVDITDTQTMMLDEIDKQAARIADFVTRFSQMKEIKTVKYLQNQPEEMLDV